MAARPLILLGWAFALASCVGSNPSTPPNYSKGPNYSATSCFDNCGRDATCQMNCTNSVAQPQAFPGALQPAVGP